MYHTYHVLGAQYVIRQLLRRECAAPSFKATTWISIVSKCTFGTSIRHTSPSALLLFYKRSEAFCRSLYIKLRLAPSPTTQCTLDIWRYLFFREIRMTPYSSPIRWGVFLLRGVSSGQTECICILQGTDTLLRLVITKALFVKFSIKDNLDITS